MSADFDAHELADGQQDTAPVEPDPIAPGATTEPTEAPASTEPAPSSEPATIDPEVIAIAEQLGLPRSAAQGFESQAALVDYLNRITSSSPAQTPATPAPTPNQDAQAPPANATPAEKAAFKKFEHADFDEQFLADLNGTLESLHSRFGETGAGGDMVKQLESRLATLTNHLVVRELDNLIGSHGEQYADVLGKGPTSALGRDSAEYKARMETLLPRIEALQRSFEQMNLPAQSEEALFKSALSLAFGNRAESQARDEVAKQVEERNAQGIRPPAGQNPAPDPQRDVKERAAAAQQRILSSSQLTEEELRERAASFS